MRPKAPVLVIADRRAFWFEESLEKCSATPRAFEEGCYDNARCYDAQGGSWGILRARLKAPTTWKNRVFPWLRVHVELDLGPKEDVPVEHVASRIASVLSCQNDFTDTLNVDDLKQRIESAEDLESIFHIVRSST